MTENTVPTNNDKQQPVRATAWAVLDAEERVLAVERSRVIATDTAEHTDGARVAPLVLADLDDLEPDEEETR